VLNGFKSGVEEQLSFRQKKAATQEVAEARDQNKEPGQQL
jgi:hypothetical protein